MNDAETLVRSMLPNVGDVVLYPAVLERAYQERINDQTLPPAILALRVGGFLREEVGRNPTTRAMEHRLIRVGS